jgi:FKBP-type peptidyl-prolyl cis-trans isomerase 2
MKLPVLILPKEIIVLHKENVPWRFSMHDIIDSESLVILHVSLRWKSSFASHVEMFYVPLNVWRELELLPNSLGQGLFGQRAGSVLKASFSPGSLMPAHNDDRVRLFPQESFAQGRRVPRRGRFYPRGLLPGYAQNPQPFRCTAISDGWFSADLNHPLAKQPLELEITVVEVQKKRSDTGGVCHA